MNKWGNISQKLQQVKLSALLTSFIHKAGIAFVVQVLGVGLGYLLQVFLARVMGREEYGIYTYVLAWAAIGAIACNLGLPVAVLRFLPEYSTQSDWERFQGVIRGSSSLTLLISLSASLLGTLAVLAINSAAHIAYFVPILFGIWTLPLLALEDLQGNMFRGDRQMLAAYAPSKVLRPLLFMAGVWAVFLWADNQTVPNQPVFIVTIISMLILVICQQLWIQKTLLNQGSDRVKQPIYEFRSWLRVSLPLLLITGFIIILYQTDILMIGAFLGPTQVALYNAATKTSYLTSFIYGAAESVGAPMIASLYAKGDRSELQKLMTTMSNLIFWPTVIITLFIVAFSNYILWMFGPEFVTARWSLCILLIGQLVNAATGPVGYMLDLTGHQDKSVRVRLFTASLNIFLCYILIPKFGIIGAAIATATSVSLDNLIIYFLAVKYIGVHASFFSAFTLNNKNK